MKLRTIRRRKARAARALVPFVVYASDGGLAIGSRFTIRGVTRKPMFHVKHPIETD